jgi:DNA-binding MarR family transcriptional regulator
MRGYLSRTVDEKDRRQLIVALTDRGRGAADIQAQARERIDNELLERVGETDLLAARRVLGTLIDIRNDEAAVAKVGNGVTARSH